jgi:hypothetical protein
MKRVALILTCLFLVSCKIDTGALINVKEQYTVRININSEPTREYIVSPGSGTHAKIVSWLTSNNTGWSQTPATYIPGVVVVAKEFQLNYLNEIVIINCKEGQFVKSTEKTDYEFLLQ